MNRDWLDPQDYPLLASSTGTGFLYWLPLLASSTDFFYWPLLALDQRSGLETGTGWTPRTILYLLPLPALASCTGFLYWLPLLTSSASSSDFLYTRRSDVSNCCSVCCTSRVALLFLFPLQPADLLNLRIKLDCNLRLL